MSPRLDGSVDRNVLYSDCIGIDSDDPALFLPSTVDDDLSDNRPAELEPHDRFQIQIRESCFGKTLLNTFATYTPETHPMQWTFEPTEDCELRPLPVFDPQTNTYELAWCE